MPRNRERDNDKSAALRTRAAALTVSAPEVSVGLAMPRDRRPNLLFICTDQQHHLMMSCAGNRWLRTPNMDRLAAAGARFAKAYCTNPVCVPSRFSLFTGRMPSTIGMTHNSSRGLLKMTPEQDRGNLGQVLRAAGYETAYGGKVHTPIGLNAERLGFDYICADERDRLAVEASAFIRSRGAAASGRPWMLVTSFINPHDICYQAIRAFGTTDMERAILKNGAVELAELDEALRLPEGVDVETFFREHCPPLPDNFEPAADEAEAITRHLEERPFRARARAEWSERDWRLHRWAYHRLTERVDRQIGVVLDALEASGQAENTVIIFTSDHGDLDGAHRLEHKSVAYEEASHVPFILVHPGRIAAGRVDNDHLVCNGLDLMATCCDYAGVAQPAHNRGLSVRTVAENPSASGWREDVYGETEAGDMVCDGRWKYIDYGAGARARQLHDLRNDPGETRDCSSENPEIVARLADRIQAYRAEHAALRVDRGV